MSQIFISYQHNAYTFVVDDLVKRLEKEGFSAWWDEEIPAGHYDWRQKIDIEIENARVVVVVFTPKAAESQYVTYEWSFALGKNKIVIPLMYETTAMHSRLATHQALDFTQAKTRQWNELMLALHSYLDGEQPSREAAVVSKEAVMNALVDMLCAEIIQQNELNLFMNYDLISPIEMAEIRRRSLPEFNPKPS